MKQNLRLNNLKIKVYLIFCLSFILSSCKEFKSILSANTTPIYGNKLYFSNANKSTVKVVINGVQYDLVFDTGGADLVTLFNPKFELNSSKILNKARKSTDGFGNKKSSIAYNLDSVGTTIFKASNMYSHIKIDTSNNKSICPKDNPLQGLIGTNFYSDYKQLLINYEDGYLMYIDNNFNKANYILAKSKFSGITNKIFLKIIVNGIAGYFLFDTGNMSTTYVSKDFYEKLPQGTETIYEILQFGANSNNVAVRHKLQYNVDFKFNNNTVDTSYKANISFAEQVKDNILSLSFIKRFNWIIDYNTKQIYYQPFPKLPSIKTDADKPKQAATIVNSKNLVVGMINKSKSTYTLSSEIESVQGNNITPQNICEYRKLLNANLNWDSLQVKIKN
jgi:hypothetical protein